MIRLKKKQRVEGKYRMLNMMFVLAKFGFLEHKDIWKTGVPEWLK